MLKTTLWHEPEGFGFYLCDPHSKDFIDSTVSDEAWTNRLSVRRGFVKIAVVSEFTQIPITVQFDRDGPSSIDEAAWDRIVECPLEIRSASVAFESAVGEEFARLDVPSGHYRLQICYGGQNTRQHSGESEDFYLIQIWPSKDTSTKIIKP
jgi:hypothetical protein